MHHVGVPLGRPGGHQQRPPGDVVAPVGAHLLRRPAGPRRWRGRSTTSLPGRAPAGRRTAPATRPPGRRAAPTPAPPGGSGGARVEGPGWPSGPAPASVAERSGPAPARRLRFRRRPFLRRGAACPLATTGAQAPAARLASPPAPSTARRPGAPASAPPARRPASPCPAAGRHPSRLYRAPSQGQVGRLRLPWQPCLVLRVVLRPVGARSYSAHASVPLPLIRSHPRPPFRSRVYAAGATSRLSRPPAGCGRHHARSHPCTHIMVSAPACMSHSLQRRADVRPTSGPLSTPPATCCGPRSAAGLRRLAQRHHAQPGALPGPAGTRRGRRRYPGLPLAPGPGGAHRALPAAHRGHPGRPPRQSRPPGRVPGRPGGGRGGPGGGDRPAAPGRAGRLRRGVPPAPGGARPPAPVAGLRRRLRRPRRLDEHGATTTPWPARTPPPPERPAGPGADPQERPPWSDTRARSPAATPEHSHMQGGAPSMRLLILGGTVFLGRHAVDAALRPGAPGDPLQSRAPPGGLPRRGAAPG